MKISKLIALSFIIALLHYNCVKEFAPPSHDFENLLVIEAFLSDDDNNFEVKLSRTIPIDTSVFIPEIGARVTLYGEDGEQFQLYENESGIYETNGAVRPNVGSGYYLRIETPDGNVYESETIIMRDTPPIDDLYFEYKEVPSAGVSGAQILIDTHDPENNTWYYRWEWEETWKFRTPYDSYLIYEEGEVKLRGENINTCWKHGKSTSIEIASSTNLSEDRISMYPIRYVTTESDRLVTRYSINVKQYSLSEGSYNYWLELEKVTESLGTLFDPQPAIVKGNFRNVRNEKDVVLGYFDASTVKEKRIYITRSDLPAARYPNFFQSCEDSITSQGNLLDMIKSGYTLIGEDMLENGFPGFSFSFNYCIDCRLYGSNIKPEFWED